MEPRPDIDKGADGAGWVVALVNSSIESKEPDWSRGDSIHYVESDIVTEIIESNYSQIIDLVEQTYRDFYNDLSVNPDTYSMKFPAKPDCRINALPCYVGGSTNLAGLKWVSSFPGNVEKNIQRASALIVLNSFETGQPIAILDGTRISAARTVASAVLAAKKTLVEKKIESLVLVGSGVIHRELITLFFQDGWEIGNIQLVDPDDRSCQAFVEFCLERFGFKDLTRSDNVKNLEPASVMSFATTALVPWFEEELAKYKLVLHLSLRDIKPENMAAHINVVDHIPHALKANTSLHMLSQSRLQYELGDFRLFEQKELYLDRTTIVSAFGMGMLDIALASYVMDKADMLNAVHDIKGLRASSGRWS